MSNPGDSDTVTSDGRFTCEVVNGVPVVAAPEEIDITNASALQSALLAAAAHGRGRLVVDLTRTRFCDSATVHTLVAAPDERIAIGGVKERNSKSSTRKISTTANSSTVVRYIDNQEEHP